jgi:hypothetical protein
MAKDIQDSEYAKSLVKKRKDNPKDFQAQKAQYQSAIKQDEDTSQPGTMEMLGNLGRSIKDSVMGKKAGGMCGGGKAKKMASGGSASSRADGCAQRGKTKGRMV